MTKPVEELTVVVDQDGGVDDALALALLAHDPNVTIVGVGSVHGNVDADTAARNAVRVLELAGMETTPVASGASRPLQQALHLAHPADLLGKLAGAPRGHPAKASAVEQLLAAARMHAGRLSVLTLGPLTNLAKAVHADPQLPHLVRRVVMMGGAYRVGGNASATAESNIWHDPEAADIVLGAGFGDLTLVPLDITRDVTVTRLWLHHLAHRGGPGRRVAQRLLACGHRLPSFAMHDALAAAILLDPQIATYERQCLRVELNGDQRGRIVPFESGTRQPVAIAHTADRRSLFTQLHGALRGPVAARWRERRLTPGVRGDQKTVC
ncbi:nucleoside hydrolase [Prauserella sp. PE36]|uniref:nucleoside hydrolase n=1 Tax=Prauserella sp. PE36 TaxID=1504709 RepID=UPI001314BC70|nr:nucleoside hydrolase [Prauserella sp. PE36]